MKPALLDPDEALCIILDACAALPTQHCAVADAMNRVLRESVVSPASLPPFDNSAMDGYALGGGGEALPAGTEWPIEGEQAAGDRAVHAGQGAWEIMTGAHMPSGLDRVIPVERTERLEHPARVRLLADVTPGQNVRLAGTDVDRGETVLAAGTLLAPQHLMLLAALGVAEVPVATQPRVAVLCTGRELVDDPIHSLVSGQIHNSNGPFLAARVPLAGAKQVHGETVGDDVNTFIAAFERARAAGARIVVSTGAVSMGRYDFVPQALELLGAEILFHKLAIRPGKPLLFARLHDGTLFFGLPGNPISVAVGWRFFVEPALRHMLGLPRERPWRVPLATDYAQKRSLRFHLKSKITLDREGRLAVTVLPGQQSYRIRPLAEANAWVVTSPDTTALPAGSLVDVHGLGHLESPMPVWSEA
ncbi:MAG TPA: gephyrin-like molybdotransferase Glp [Rhodanobacteraceae bacterium]|nr:gephyrin-like molybdotransferase Glp [Rhodanobacteraceae bacterium]